MTDWIKVETNVITVIAKKYEKTELSLGQDVTTLKEWMKSQPHLPEILDEKSILNFLILNKCSVENAKKKIDMYYTLRSRFPEMFRNPKNANVRMTMDVGCWVLLPKPTKDLHRVWLYKILQKGMAEKLDTRDVNSLIVALQEVRLKEDVLYGDIFVIDLEGTSVTAFTKLTPTLLSKIYVIYEKVFSTPLKGVFFLNSPSYLTILLSMMKKLLKPKLFSRIVVCEDTSALLEHFPKDMLPKNYGGEEKTIEELLEQTKAKFRQYQNRFDELETLTVNEKLRPEPLENCDVLGFHGNFKKLDVD